MHEITVELLTDAYNSYSSFRKKNKPTTLLPTDITTTHLGDLLCLNFYEISEWQYKYLNIWCIKPDYPFITTRALYTFIHIKPMAIIEYYFAIYEQHIGPIEFIPFLCVFVFFPLDSILPLLLSICGVHSNYSLNSTQILTFLHSIGCEPAAVQYTEDWIKHEETNSGRIPMRNFLQYISTHSSIIKPVKELKSALITNIVSLQSYNAILQRKSYYDMPELLGHGPEFESCTDMIVRSIFTHKPSPQHTDYSPQDSTQSYQSLIYLLRCRYGYSKRPNCSLQCSSRFSSGRYEEGIEKIKGSVRNNDMSCSLTPSARNLGVFNSSEKRSSLTISMLYKSKSKRESVKLTNLAPVRQISHKETISDHNYYTPVSKRSSVVPICFTFEENYEGV